MKNAALPVLFGLLVGFLATYLLVRDRVPGPVVLSEAVGSSALPAAETGRTREMIAALEQRLASNPDDPVLLADLANLNFEIQAYAESIDYYQRAIALNPDDVNLHADLATAYYYSGRTSNALEQFEQALDIAPGHPQTLFNMGVVLLEENNDVDGAIELWERLIQMNPGYAQNAMVQQEIDRLRAN